MTNITSVISPLPGTIYFQASPTEPQYKLIGDEVKTGDVIALVEVMKTFYEIKAEQDGFVEQFNVENGQTIDAGQEILSIKSSI